jgi:hypothetical protein
VRERHPRRRRDRFRRRPKNASRCTGDAAELLREAGFDVAAAPRSRRTTGIETVLRDLADQRGFALVVRPEAPAPGLET